MIEAPEHLGATVIDGSDAGLVRGGHDDLRRMVDALEGGQLYRSEQVCDLADLSYRVLHYWTHVGLIEPVKPGRGSGTQALWSGIDVAIVCTLAALRRRGAAMDVLERMEGWLRGTDWPMVGLVLIPVEGEPYRVSDGEELTVALATERSAVWLVDLDEVTATLRELGAGEVAA